MALATAAPRWVGLRYRRISFDDSVEQLRRQEADIDVLCDLHGYDTSPTCLFTDEDESGNEDTRYRQRKGERPGLLALDTALHQLTAAGLSVVVVAWEPGRLFRDAGHKEHYFRRWSRAGNVLVHTKAGLWNPKDGRDRFISTLLAAGDQFYSDSVREKVVRAHEERRKQGRVATGWPGFGYERDNNGDWVVTPAEARLIREAATDLLAGKTAISIVERWRQKKVPTKLGGEWTLTTFRRVMTKPSLIGIVVHKGEEVGRGSWEPILDEATFRRVQLRLGRRNGPRAGAQLLTGLLYCGRCGTKLNSNRKGSRPVTRVYGCRACGGSNVDGPAVEAVYVEKMWERLNDERFLEALRRSDDPAEAVAAELAEQQAELEELTARADSIPLAAYLAKAEAIKQRMADINERITSAAAGVRVSGWVRNLRTLRRAWADMSVDEQRSILAAVVGPSRVESAGTSGQRVTPERIRRQLWPLQAGDGEKRSRPTRSSTGQGAAKSPDRPRGRGRTPLVAPRRSGQGT